MNDVSLLNKAAAYRVETDRLLLRCWSPEDAPALRAALDESDQHLRPWIPFMKDEPRTLSQTVDWLRQHRANFDTDKLYRYGVFSREDQTLVGENMLLPRDWRVRRSGEGGSRISWVRECTGRPKTHAAKALG